MNRLEKVTDENERLSEELKFKEQKVQSLQKRFVKTNSCYVRSYCILLKQKETKTTTNELTSNKWNGDLTIGWNSDWINSGILRNTQRLSLRILVCFTSLIYLLSRICLLPFRVEELMLSLDESSEALHRNLKQKEKENRNLERRYRNEKSDWKRNVKLYSWVRGLLQLL